MRRIRGFCAVKWLIRNLGLYLTDFQNRAFIGEIAKNRSFGGGKIRKSGPIYHARIYHAARYDGLHGLLVIRNPPSGGATGGNPSMENHLAVVFLPTSQQNQLHIVVSKSIIFQRPCTSLLDQGGMRWSKNRKQFWESISA